MVDAADISGFRAGPAAVLTLVSGCVPAPKNAAIRESFETGSLNGPRELRISDEQREADERDADPFEGPVIGLRTGSPGWVWMWLSPLQLKSFLVGGFAKDVGRLPRMRGKPTGRVFMSLTGGDINKLTIPDIVRLDADWGCTCRVVLIFVPSGYVSSPDTGALSLFPRVTHEA